MILMSLGPVVGWAILLTVFVGTPTALLIGLLIHRQRKRNRPSPRLQILRCEKCPSKRVIKDRGGLRCKDCGWRSHF